MEKIYDFNKFDNIPMLQQTNFCENFLFDIPKPKRLLFLRIEDNVSVNYIKLY